MLHRISPGCAWNADSNKFVPKTYVHNGTQRFDSEIQCEEHGHEGRIHLTGKLIPPANSGGSNGWWTLNDLQVTPEKITARYRMNSLNKPKVEIDRRTGSIKIDGIEKFKGECDQGNRSQRGERFQAKVAPARLPLLNETRDGSCCRRGPVVDGPSAASC